ncbi:MAG: hypothetical protein JKY37_16985 [Nannocystaceae bacterium]|nr:hypothetical protein [Nannocystaceae bacterium]
MPFDVAGQYWGPRRVLPFEQARTAGVVVQQGGIAAKVCVIPTNGALEVASCLGADAGVARAGGVGLDVSRVTNAPWVAMSIGQELTWVSRRRVGVWVAADAMVHIVRPQWRVRDLGIAAKTGPVGFRLVVGPTLRL